MRTRVVCISRALGAGGEAVGKAVAQRLGFRYVDEEVIKVASEKAKIDPALVEKAEHRQSVLSMLMDALGAGGVVEGYLPIATESYIPSPSVGVVLPGQQETLRSLIREAITEIAAAGNAVIVAHAASFALAGQEGVLRVFVTATPETRTQRLWLDGKLLSEAEAETARKESDRERESYLKRFYAVSEELPTHYDLTVNTDVLPLEVAVAAIVAAAGK